jgi:hypothetical protein
VPALVERYRHLYAPEIPDRGRPTPGSDIYLATNVVRALMRCVPPEVATGRLASSPELERFMRGCLGRRPDARPDDAWGVLAELDDVLTGLYGPRRFRPFAMPATAPTWPSGEGATTPVVAGDQGEER